MSPLVALARRAAACTEIGQHGRSLFHFLPGMQVQSALDDDHPAYHSPGRVIRSGYATAAIYVPYGEIGYGERPACVDDLLPDFSDELTRLSMIALVRAAWGSAETNEDDAPNCDGWLCWVLGRQVTYRGATELEALLVALERAPTKASQAAAVRGPLPHAPAGPFD